MKKLCRRKYLKYGEYTEPFLDRDQLIDIVNRDNKAHAGKSNYTVMDSIMRYLAKYVRTTKDIDFKKDNKFKRTAGEIWESKVATSCTDYAYLYATCCRQLGIPTTILHTAERNYLKDLKSNTVDIHSGHAFCECFYEGKWILVDPTNKKVIGSDYDVKNIIADYMSPKRVYVAYDRNLDLSELFINNINQTSYTEYMDMMCKDL